MSETIIMKTCGHCKQTKSVSEFSKETNRKDGYYFLCKICQSQYHKQWQKTKTGRKSTRKIAIKYSRSKHGQSVSKAYRQSEKGKNSHKRCNKKYRNRFPERIKATKFVYCAITIGVLPRPDSLQCNYCPNQAEQYHHWHGYQPEHYLDVIPVCIPCHNFHPRTIRG